VLTSRDISPFRPSSRIGLLRPASRRPRWARPLSQNSREQLSRGPHKVSFIVFACTRLVATISLLPPPRTLGRIQAVARHLTSQGQTVDRKRRQCWKCSPSSTCSEPRRDLQDDETTAPPQQRAFVLCASSLHCPYRWLTRLALWMSLDGTYQGWVLVLALR